MKSTLNVVGVSLATVAGVLLATSSIAQERVLKVTNWGEYIGEETIANFEAEYPVRPGKPL